MKLKKIYADWDFASIFHLQNYSFAIRFSLASRRSSWIRAALRAGGCDVLGEHEEYSVGNVGKVVNVLGCAKSCKQFAVDGHTAS